MSKQSETIDRTNRALSIASNQMKRQRSVEWQQEYASTSSEEENDRINGSRMVGEANMSHRKNSSNPSPSRDSVLAKLIAQTQQLSSSE